MYNPSNQYRCTIIRGKSQTDMEDLLPIYANMVHKFCPCEEEQFKVSCCKALSKALFQTEAFDRLSPSNRKTVQNHLTEVAGTLLGLYFPKREASSGDTIVYETASCRQLIESDDYPTFFKNLCLNFQFPNGAKSHRHIETDMANRVCLKPFCFVVELLLHAQSQPGKELLTKQEVGYYALNNLDVLRGEASASEVFGRIMSDRRAGVKRERLHGSRDWQHIKEQFNILELANVIETDATYLWLNAKEAEAIELFVRHKESFVFDAYGCGFSTKEEREAYVERWKAAYGTFNSELSNVKTSFGNKPKILERDEQNTHRGAMKSNVGLGDDGEALVFRLERARVGRFKERLVNKVLLLGKTKGLGYDIASIEADENPAHPEFARYIEVKSTKRVTEPSFDGKAWMDSLFITAKEWVAAEQYGAYYNIYRVYFTKEKTIVVRIRDPFEKSQKGEIEVYPTVFQMDFNASVIERRYEERQD